MGRNSFLMYVDNLEMIEELEDYQIGVLFRAIMRYEAGKELPEMDGMTRVAFKAIKKTLDADQKKYEETVEKRAEAGRLGGLKRSQNQANAISDEANQANAIFASQNEASQADTDTVTVTDTDINKKESAKADKKKIFIPPTVEEVENYCRERKNRVDAQSFVDFYSSKGWMIGKNHMKDWKAAVRTWERNNKGSPQVNQFTQFPQRDYDFDDLEKKLLSN